MSPTPFSIASSLEPKGQDCFVGTIPTGWSVVVGTHGGLIAALMTRAAGLVTGPERPIRSITIHFARPAKPGEITIEATREREGSRISALSLRMKQGGETVALALAAGGALRESMSFTDLPMPDVPAPEAIPQLEYLPGVMPQFMAHADFRPVWSGSPGSPSSTPDAIVGGWMRALEGAPLDAPGCAFLADMWWPAVFAVSDGPVGAPTIDLTIHFRSELPPADSQPDQFTLGRFRSRLIDSGHFEEDGVLWSSSGKVLAQSRQLALVLPLPPGGIAGAKI
ncbi:MAG: hypothetical protein F2799_00930 [Actinobacteria bacterium]|uniref:Unannotated protein n=1 Tax=freshwater metagenome TaxID=449393 RepID=A0A6J7CYH5_9ZZZZ|nr:hypothetical protein [Actinomycetota bacterium]